MDAHTPGPWRVDPASDGRIVAGHVYVALVTSGLDDGVDHGPVFESNGRLIAAAPDLLAALKDALAELSPLMQAYRAEHHDDICGRARAAIAKAEGV